MASSRDMARSLTSVAIAAAGVPQSSRHAASGKGRSQECWCRMDAMIDLRERAKHLSARLPVGRLAVGLALVGMLLSMILAAPNWLTGIFQAGFIGGFTNTVAIYMLFTETWFLPGSGVLLKRKDAIVVSLAETMQEHILNPSLIEARVRQLARAIDYDRVIEGLNAIVDELRADTIRFILAEDQRTRIGAAVQSEGGFWAEMANAAGIIRYSDIADRIAAGLVKQVQDFTLDRRMLEAAAAYVGNLEDFLLEPGNPMVKRHYGSELSVAQLLFEKLDARQLVIDRLSAYEAEQIRELLAWLEVFGVLLGMLIAGLVLAIGALF